jgi:hypothetical protein
MNSEAARKCPYYWVFAGITPEGPGRGRLPKLLIACIDPRPWGHVAEWLRKIPYSISSV